MGGVCDERVVRRVFAVVDHSFDAMTEGLYRLGDPYGLTAGYRVVVGVAAAAVRATLWDAGC